jgi:hypothetical protein
LPYERKVWPKRRNIKRGKAPSIPNDNYAGLLTCKPPVGKRPSSVAENLFKSGGWRNVGGSPNRTA